MENIGIGKITLKKQTRANVLKIIKNEGPISRVDIASRLGLTRAAITIITDDLISQEVIYEVGSDNSRNAKRTQGRRKIFLDINANYRFAFGICAEGNHVSMGLSTLGGDSLDKINLEINNENSSLEYFCRITKDSYDKLLKNNYLDSSMIIGVGVGCDTEFYNIIGIVDNKKTNQQKTLAKALYEAFGMPVCVDNSSLTLALANIYFPEKRDGVVVSDAIFLQCHDSFGLIKFNNSNKEFDINNDIINVDDYVINFNGRELPDTPRGSLKAEISKTALHNKISARYPDISNEMIDMIIEGYNSENVIGAVEIKNECIRMFGTFLYNLVQTKKVQRIILHKFQFSDYDYSYLLKYLENEFADKSVHHVICRSRIGENYAFLGGCALAVREFFVECGGLDLKVKKSE